MEKKLANVYLLLGSNLGDRRSNLEVARFLLEELAGNVKNYSLIYETDPWGKTDQGVFLNQVLHLETALAPEVLLEKILKIEKQIGRVRTVKWAERLIDIDILFYNDLILEIPELVIPHPGIPDRKFALVPLCELIPDFIHPKLGIPLREVLENSVDKLLVRVYDVLDPVK